jgi:hypothetical protein
VLAAQHGADEAGVGVEGSLSRAAIELSDGIIVALAEQLS